MKKLIFLILILSITLPSFAADSDSLTIVELKTQVEELQEKQKGINWNTVLPISLVIAVIGGLLYNLTRTNIKTTEERMLKQFETRLEKQIIETINDKKETINHTLESANLERRLLNSKRIYMWGEEDDDIIRQVLRNVRFNVAENYFTTENEANKGYDVLLINNKNNKMDMEEMITKVKGLPEHIHIFYYNATGHRFLTEKIDSSQQHRVNFANAASQIYGNLLNTLKYQDQISQNR